MGVQDLLMLVLSIILVGVAVAIGVRMFNDQSHRAAEQYLVQDLESLASHAVALYQTPRSQVGFGRSYSGMTIDNLTSSPSNENGTYWLTVTDSTCTIFGRSLETRKTFRIAVSRLRIGNVERND
jgi:hypothetical protein